MNVLVCLDKFKGSISALEGSNALAKGISKNIPSAKLTVHPMADGGDGTLKVLKTHLGLQLCNIKTQDALGREVTSQYGVKNSTAFIELANASGIHRLSKKELSPLTTSTVGTGIEIKHALNSGCKKITLMLGGSCSTDAGTGIASTLGYTFLNQDGRILNPCGGNLIHIHSFERTTIPSFELTVLSDVNNPLHGPQGAAYVFSPQKGAQPKEVKTLDDGLRHFAQVVNKMTDKDIQSIKGSGAAGGIAGGLCGLLDAQVRSGFDYVAEITKLEQAIIHADVIITGEGQLDQSSFNGKVVGGVSHLSAKHQKPMLIVCGKKKVDFHSRHKIFDIFSLAKDAEDSMNNAQEYLYQLGASLDASILIGPD